MPKPLRQFFSYFGGKHRNGDKYPAPTYDTVIEPFAGGAGYAHRYWEHDVILVDLSEPVVLAWQYLIDATAKDILGLPLLAPGDRLSSFGLSPGESAFVGFCLVRASASPRDKATSWMEKYPTRVWGEHVRRAISEQVHHINHWHVIRGTYRDIDNIPATWFVDPPYVEAGHFYPCSGVDYDHLAGWCMGREGQVMVCEAEGADWLPFQPLYEHKGIQRAKRTEVVWLNS